MHDKIEDAETKISTLEQKIQESAINKTKLLQKIL